MQLIISLLCAIVILLVTLPRELFYKQNLLKSLIKQNNIQTEHTDNFGNKTLTGLVQLSRWVNKYIPSAIMPKNIEKYRNNLIYAGYANKISVKDFVGLKYTSMLFFALYFTLFFLLNPTKIMAFGALLATVMGYYVPDNWLLGKAKKRQGLIERDIPSVLSYLAITTDAGLNLLQAIEEVTIRRNGELSKEFKKTFEDIKIGIPQKDAFERLCERCNVEEMNYFISALVQALEKGNSGITALLRDQAKESWDKRKEKAKELAEKASIKLFMPLLLLVFPAFTIFLLGPMVFAIADMLFK